MTPIGTFWGQIAAVGVVTTLPEPLLSVDRGTGRIQYVETLRTQGEVVITA
jgi:hypothetical protein